MTDNLFTWQRNLIDALRGKDVLLCYGNIRDRFVYNGQVGQPQLCDFNTLLSHLLGSELGPLCLFDPIDRLTRASVRAEQVAFEPAGAVGGLALATEPVANSFYYKPDADLSALLRHMSAPYGPAEPGREQIRTLVVANPSAWLGAESGSGDEVERRKLLLRRLLEKLGKGRKLILTYLNINQIPPELYLNAPQVATMEIPLPDPNERKVVCQIMKLPARLHDSCANLTEGLSTLETTRILELAPVFLKVDSLERLAHSGEVERAVRQFKFGERPDYYDRLSAGRLRTAEDFFIRGIERDDSGNELGRMPGIMGQDQAVQMTIKMLWRAKASVGRFLHDPGSMPPRGVMFFCGPSGTGKTMLAKRIARFLFSNEENFCRFDMSEYMQDFAVSRLIGAPPGYVGSDAGGQLTNAIRQKPFSVILFDEVEKAHPRVLDIFLQILSDGRLTDSHGQTVFFSEAIVIFTSNIGMRSQRASAMGRGAESNAPCEERARYDALEQEFRAALAAGHNQAEVVAGHHAKVRAHFLSAVNDFYEREISRPELLNRFGNNIIPFYGVSGKDIVREMFKSYLFKLSQRFGQTYEQRQWSLSIDPQVTDYFVEGHAEQVERFGGRAVVNALEDDFLTELARRLIELSPGERNVTLRARVVKRRLVMQ